jgi:hypothetical protein
MQMREKLEDFKDRLADNSGSSNWGKLLSLFIIVVLLIAAIFGFIWSSEPDRFAVMDNAATQAEKDGRALVVGYTTAATLYTVADTLLKKPGGYLSNDIMIPGVWLDNIPSWEFGVLVQVRDLTRALRKDFSRSQSQSTEDEFLSIVEPQFHFDSDSFAVPSTEGEYKRGLKALHDYMLSLSDPDNQKSQFYARSDNLQDWLADVETRLGSLSQRLSDSVGRVKLNTDLAGERYATQSTTADAMVDFKTSWLEIDDVFYEARGSAWALSHMLKAIEIDFQTILQKKNALISLRQIIRELDDSQESMWSPVILNGSGFGLLANHSLVMASYLSRANAAIIDLRELLNRG